MANSGVNDMISSGQIRIDPNIMSNSIRDRPPRTDRIAVRGGSGSVGRTEEDMVRDRVMGNWNAEVLGRPERTPSPVREEVTADLFRIFEWAYKNQIQVRLHKEAGQPLMAVMIFKRGERSRSFHQSSLEDLYRDVKANYRDLFAELRCPELNLEV